MDVLASRGLMFAGATLVLAAPIFGLVAMGVCLAVATAFAAQSWSHRVRFRDQSASRIFATSSSVKGRVSTAASG